MASDYEAISQENRTKYGTEVSNYGTDFAERYSNRTHFIFELLQNAEDALRWRGDRDRKFLRTVRFDLFPDRLEVRHFGIPFRQEHVRAICGIKRGTKESGLNTIGEFGIGFKSVYAYTQRPEIHSGDEHFVIRDYVHPHAIHSEYSKKQPDETLFVLPFDHPEIESDRSYREIATKLRDLGLRTLLFLNWIDAIEWSVGNDETGRYARKMANKFSGKGRIVTLIANTPGDTITEEEWLVFSRTVRKPSGAAGQTEVAYQLGDRRNHRVILPVEDSTLAVYFPTEKETHLGFLIQGPYKTTSSRDNVPSDDSWNQWIVAETAQLVADSLHKLKAMKMLSISALAALPLDPFHFGEGSMFRPIHLQVVETLKKEELIPTMDDHFVRAADARIAGSKSLMELLSSDQLRLLLKSDGEVEWVNAEALSDSRRGVLDFLKTTIGIATVSIHSLVDKFDAPFLTAQKDAWIAHFYAFLLEYERLWRVEKPRGPLLEQPIIRLQDGDHVTPFRADGSPSAYLPADAETEFPTVRRVIVKHRKAGEFLRKLKLTMPDVGAEVLEKVLPQYSVESAIPERKHLSNLKKILKALALTDGKHEELLRERLADVPFLRGARCSDGAFGWRRPCEVYFRTSELQTYAEGNDGMWFLAEPIELVSRENVRNTLATLGVEDKPRRVIVEKGLDYDEQWQLRGGSNHNWKTITNYGLDGLENFLHKLKSSDFVEAHRRALLLWDFLILHIDSGCGAFFYGRYVWHHYKERHAFFDAHFLRLLRSEAWLPGKDGIIHRPSELMPRDLPKGFTPNTSLISTLGMKAEVLVSLAKEAGIRVEDLDFLRGHRAEWEQFKRAIKARTIALDEPATAGATVPTEKKRIASEAERDRFNRDRPESTSAQSGKFISYIYVRPEESIEVEDNENDNSADRFAVDDAGLAVVLDHERSEGRMPKRMAHTHPGFDVLSSTAAGTPERYIEVKSASAVWSERGVTLSQRQFLSAQALKEKFWLYIVERANSAKPRLIRIQNPAQLARSFTFDSGWESVAERSEGT